MAKQSFTDSALRTIAMERDAVAELLNRINTNFDKACELILTSGGRVVVTGMGKSGHIGTKIAATLASTGTPSLFVHPAEASHGDIGMITPKDVVLALSNSGNTQEIVVLLPLLKRMHVPLISITGHPDAVLSTTADAHLDASVALEACPLNLAPTSSTTVALVLGDALAIALLEARGFTAENFAFSHPGGTLGRRLLLKVKDVMHSGQEAPKVSPDTMLSDTLLEMSSKNMGMTMVVDVHNRLLGVFTDGDLRRVIAHGDDIHATPIHGTMTHHCKTVTGDMLAAEALHMMDEHKIAVLPVIDEHQQAIGIVHLYDLLKAGIV